MASKKLRRRVKKTIRKTRKIAGRAASVVLPIVGAVVAGPVGAAAGTALGTAASFQAEKDAARLKGKRGRAVRKAGRRGIKAGLIRGGIVTAGAGAVALASGAGATTGVLKAAGLVGSAAQSVAGGGQRNPSINDEAPLPPGTTDQQSGSIFDTIGKTLTDIFGSGQGQNNQTPPEDPGRTERPPYVPDFLAPEPGGAELFGFSPAKLALAAAVVVGGVLVVKSLSRRRRRAG